MPANVRASMPRCSGWPRPRPLARCRRRRRRGRDRERSEDNWSGEPVAVEGFLDLRDEGYGFLRVKGMLPSKDDVYVPVK